MRRRVAALQTWWTRLFVVLVLVAVLVELSVPLPLELAVLILPLALSLVRPPRSERGPVPVAAPVTGTWVALNSPGTRVPSHGVRAYAQDYAIDILHPPAEGERRGSRWWPLTRRPGEYSSFGEPVLAMADGTVVTVRDDQRDHRSRDSWPALVVMLVIAGFLRELAGVRRILGNHVVLVHGDGTFSLYAHLRHRSARVRPGDAVRRGQVVAQVGNTGNTSEPHLHVQLMDAASPTAAAGVPFVWDDVEVTGRVVDELASRQRPAAHAVDGVPANGAVFRTVPVGVVGVGVEGAQQPDAGSLLGSAGHRPQRSQVPAVQGDDEVVLAEVGLGDLPGPVTRRVVPAGGEGGHGPPVGGLADVPVPGPAGPDVEDVAEALLLGAPAQHGLGHRRAADVAGADERHAVAVGHRPMLAYRTCPAHPGSCRAGSTSADAGFAVIRSRAGVGHA